MVVNGDRKRKQLDGELEEVGVIYTLGAEGKLIRSDEMVLTFN